MLPNVIYIAIAMAISLAGVVAAFYGWRDAKRRWLAVATGLWLLSTFLWCHRFGVEIGLPLAIETGALAAFAFILSRAERRPVRDARPSVRVAPAPQRWRGVARAAIAGPLAMAAAMGIAVFIAVGAPLGEQTRLILAGLIVPSLWAAMIVWTLAERRLLRPGLGLAAIGAASFAAVLLPGI